MKVKVEGARHLKGAWHLFSDKIARMIPEVSVVIPTYNRRAFLEKAVDAVLSQTYRDFELIVVDDGSFDDTESLLQDPPRSHGTALSLSPVRYLYQKNTGVAAARNRGIAEAKGKWIAFLDSDDTWLATKLERQMEFHARHTDHLISQTEEIWIRKGARVNPMKKHAKPAGWIFEPSLALCLVSPSSVVIAREVFKKVGLFDETFPVCEDYEFWLRVSLAFPVGLVEEALVVKQGGHPDQLSRRYWGLDRFRIQALEKVLRNFSLTDDQRKACVRELARKCRIYARGCARRRREEEASAYLALAAKYEDPHAVLSA